MTDAADLGHMRAAIALATARLGLTGRNPAVGCVIVGPDGVVGEGATGEGGRPHAEEIALAIAGDKARGSTVYVTLEPCAGRTAGGASCSALLLAASVARVVIACDDGSLFAGGAGPQRLTGAGVAVEIGLLGDEARSALYSDYRPHPGE